MAILTILTLDKKTENPYNSDHPDVYPDNHDDYPKFPNKISYSSTDKDRTHG